MTRRRPRLRGVAVVVGALVAVLVGVGVVVSLRPASTAAAAGTVADGLEAWAGDLRRAQPEVGSVDVDARPGDGRLVDVAVDVAATSATGEADPALLATVLDSACSRTAVLAADLDLPVPAQVRVTTVLTDRTPLADGARPQRSVTLSCGAGSVVSSPVLAWFAQVAAHPFGPGVGDVSVQQRQPGSFRAYLRVLSAADVDPAVEVGCARGAGADPAAAATATLLVSVAGAPPDAATGLVDDAAVVCADEVSP